MLISLDTLLLLVFSYIVQSMSSNYYLGHNYKKNNKRPNRWKIMNSPPADGPPADDAFLKVCSTVPVCSR